MDAMNREALNERMHAHEESLIELRREAVNALAQILMLCDRMESTEKRISHLEARSDG
jgi:hypothetical protein